jgi:hypothetical protein
MWYLSYLSAAARGPALHSATLQVVLVFVPLIGVDGRCAKLVLEK